MATAIQDCTADRTAQQQEMATLLLNQHLFPDVDDHEIACLVAVSTEVQYQPGETLVDEHADIDAFIVFTQGRVRIQKLGGNREPYFQKTISAPSFMGEASLLAGIGSSATVIALEEVHGIRVEEQDFWNLMSQCPGLRAAIRREMTRRTVGTQQMASQQEKLVALGTMTAGLMHELNNPGAAAQRAASQLRENLRQMHQLARSFAERGHTEPQRACLSRLQERVLQEAGSRCMDSLQQSDAEEELGTWLDEQGISTAWSAAPTLVASGLDVSDLQCLQEVFRDQDLQEPLNWLEATASSMQQVGLVEDSVSRVHALAKAVKTYAHEGQGGQQTVNVNESLHATLVILKHKAREKNIHMEKSFGAGLPPLTCVCTGLNQIWTNLIDNAIDAAPPEGHIGVKTWLDDGAIHVAITDDGPGIDPENQQRIFDPFFTTKPAGQGTGMGLGIVMRMLELYQGHLQLHSKPGHTEFEVILPAEIPAG